MRTIYVAILGLGLGLIQVLRYICFSTDSKTILMVGQSGMY